MEMSFALSNFNNWIRYASRWGNSNKTNIGFGESVNFAVAVSKGLRFRSLKAGPQFCSLTFSALRRSARMCPVAFEISLDGEQRIERNITMSSFLHHCTNSFHFRISPGVQTETQRPRGFASIAIETWADGDPRRDSPLEIFRARGLDPRASK